MEWNKQLLNERIPACGGQDVLRKARLALLVALFLAWPAFRAAAQDAVHSARHVMRITEGLSSPIRLAIDDRDGVYVTDAVRGRICKYDSTGLFLGEFAAGAAPLALAVTPQRLVYVGDRLSGALRIFDSEGRLLKSGTKGLDVFHLPSCAVLDDAGRVYVSDSKRKVVTVIDADGDTVRSFGEGILQFPTGLAFDFRNNRILVADHGGLFFSDSSDNSGMIHAFDLQGRLLASFGDYGPEINQFTRIQGMTVDRWGRIYVADPYRGVVKVLNENGALLAVIGEFGAEPGQFQAPMDVALDSRGRLWVASMNSGSLEVFDVGDITTGVESAEWFEMPASSELLQNYPNPFNPGTWIPFKLAEDGEAVIRIYNEVGKLIRKFDLGYRKRGAYAASGKAVYWDGTNSRGERVASGLYFYEIRAGSYVAARRMLLLK